MLVATAKCTQQQLPQVLVFLSVAMSRLCCKNSSSTVGSALPTKVSMCSQKSIQCLFGRHCSASASSRAGAVSRGYAGSEFFFFFLHTVSEGDLRQSFSMRREERWGTPGAHAHSWRHGINHCSGYAALLVKIPRNETWQSWLFSLEVKSSFAHLTKANCWNENFCSWQDKNYTARCYFW